MRADEPDDFTGIPDFLKREDKGPSQTKVSPMTRASDVTVAADAETMPKAVKAKAKANGATHKPVKAAGKAKAVKVAKAKAPAKAKAAKPAKEAIGHDKFGFRDGSLKSKAATMYSTKKGATLEEIKTALGSVQLNLLKDLEAKGHTVTKVKEDGEGKRKVTRYHLS